MIREQPLQFTATSVQGIIAGTKSQTRRILRPQPYDFPHPSDRHRCWNASGAVGGRIAMSDEALLELHGWIIGQHRWVREAWAQRLDLDHLNGSQLYAAGIRTAWYWADGPAKCFRTGCAGAAGRYRNARFMPRWASRITLEVTGLRLQRLQEISAEDAIAEGIDPAPHRCGCERCAQTSELCPATASALIEDYGHLWESLHVKPGERWLDNPWVAAISFQRIKP